MGKDKDKLFEQAYEEAVKRYQERTPKSAESFAEGCKYMPGADTRSAVHYHPYPLTLEAGKGAVLTDVDGNDYLDFLGNYTSLIHGNAHPVVAEAAAEAAAKGTAAPMILPEQQALAKMLVERVPSVETVRFCNSGTEATMFAMRAARAYTGKDGIIKMEGGYHGTTDQVEYATDTVNETPEGELIKPVPDYKGISVNAGKDIYIARFNNGRSVEEILEKHADKIAAIIVEPVMGGAGVIPAKKEFLQDLRMLADKYDVLLIFDEIQTLRMSKGGAQLVYGVTPDITAMAKIIGGGYPVGGFGGKREFMEVYDPTKPDSIVQSGTFNGNRISMAAGKATLELLDDAAFEKLEKLSAALQEGLEKVIEKYGLPASVTRAGSLLNLHFTPEAPVDYATAQSPYKHLLKLNHINLLNEGIFTADRGTFVVSTVMTDADIEQFVKAFDKSMKMIAELI